MVTFSDRKDGPLIKVLTLDRMLKSLEQGQELRSLLLQGSALELVSCIFLLPLSDHINLGFSFTKRYIFNRKNRESLYPEQSITDSIAGSLSWKVKDIYV